MLAKLIIRPISRAFLLQRTKKEQLSLFITNHALPSYHLTFPATHSFSTQKELSQADMDYLKTLSDSAEVYYSKHKYTDAREALKKSADLLSKVYGEKNCDYARVLNNIGITYKIERKFEEAI